MEAIPAMSVTPANIATAYHEAGHAVMALTLGRAVQRVSVLPNHLRLGVCEFKKGRTRPTKDHIEADILVFLAGLAAEAMHTGRYGWEGAAEDLRSVRQLTKRRAGSDRAIERLERRMLDKTEHLLSQPAAWQAVTQIAAELLTQSTISGRAARHLFEQAAEQVAREK